MDRGLLTRALIIGFTCFILAAGVLYYLSLMNEQADRQNQEMVGAGLADNDGPGAIGLLMLVIVGFFVLMVAAGAITALALARYHGKWQEVSIGSALAGGTPVMLLWLVFWCMVVANVIGGALDNERFGPDDLLYAIFFLLINVISVGTGALVSGLSGFVTCTLSSAIIGKSG
jgi:hypothetical protein